MIHRVVSGSEDSSPTFRYVGNTYSRPVRHKVEPKGRGVLLSPSQPSSPPSGPPGGRLVEGTVVSVPPTGAPRSSTQVPR